MARDYEYYFAQLRRIEDHREEKAVKEIRKIYKEILKETKHFIAEEYYNLAEDGKLTFEILRSKGQDVRFLQEVENRLGDVSLDVSKEIRQTVEEMYQLAYDGIRDAVQKGSDTSFFFEGIDSSTAQTMRATVDNTIMEIALEKNHKDIVWDIKREVARSLMVGDRFEAMAHRIADNLNRSYKKAVLITRTEVGRVREAGHLASAKDLNETLKQGSSGMQMVKKWKSMRDGRVRDQHVSMHNKVVQMDEAFELPDGVKTQAPKQSGAARHDCNCRCTCLFPLMDDAEFFAATGKHFSTKKRGQGAGDGDNAAVGEAVHEKTVNFNDKQAVQREIDAAQERFAGLDHEENLTITSDGKVWRVKGKKRSVNPWAIQEAGGNLLGSHSYHNHPEAVSYHSFSADDVRFFFESGQQYSKSSDELFEYVMTRTAKTVDIAPEAIYNRFNEIEKTDIWELAWAGEIDVDADGYHEVMKRLSKEYGFKYERKELNGSK